MKLDKLIETINKKSEELDKMWEDLILATVRSETNEIPQNDSVYATPLTIGEIQLAQIMQLYDVISELAFYIADTKSKVKIPELGLSVFCAEEELAVLQHKLMYYEQLGKIANETGFKVKDVDLETKDVDIELTDLNRGFNLKALDDSIAYLKEEVAKYEDLIFKTIMKIEVIVPILEKVEKPTMKISDIPAQPGAPKGKSETETPAENQEIDVSEYKSAADYISEQNQVKTAEKPAEPEQKFTGCMVCDSPHKNNIETFYKDSENNILQTLNFATNYCKMPSLHPNLLLTHLEHHKNVNFPTSPNTGINDPDKHTPIDHTFRTAMHTLKQPIVNDRKPGNLAEGSFDPDKHTVNDHVIDAQIKAERARQIAEVNSG